jgi:hypothetical protein
MTIPFSQTVKILPSVLSAAGSAVDLNGMLLSQSPYVPSGQVLTFSSALAVANYCGPTSVEAQMATIYFNGYDGSTRKPALLNIANYPEVATGGFLRSASLASMTLTQLKALSGTLILTVGGTVFTSSSISLTAATSFSNAAAIIQAAFTSPTFTVAFDSLTGAFIFTVTATGAASTITYCTGTLATGLSLTQATGAVLSQGQAVGVVTTFMNTLLGLSRNWCTLFTTWESVIAEKQAFANWVNAQNDLFVYACQDSDINATVANSTTTFGAWLALTKPDGVIPVYANDNTSVALVAGYFASLDFTRLNGRTTLCFRTQSGLATFITDGNIASILTANGYNYFGQNGSSNPNNNQNWFSNGSTSGRFLWADSYGNQIWLNSNLQLSLINLLTSAGSIPYNNAGYALIRAACLGAIQAAINFGAIRVGVTLSASQIAQVQNALGLDASTALFANGYYLQISNASSATRVARGSPPMTLFYTDGQSVQSINLASIEIQ